jgi:uncharacterized protein YqhQ
MMKPRLASTLIPRATRKRLAGVGRLKRRPGRGFLLLILMVAILVVLTQAAWAPLVGSAA